jgi:coenzyme F420-reducing hydrogenase beta subunit
MITRHNESNCSYCGACGAACPKSCISYEQNDEGFLYPAVNEELCNNCHTCTKTCSSINPFPKTTPLSSYACKHKDDSIRDASSSGGVFYALAEHTILQNGIVFGAALNDDKVCVHKGAETLEELKPLMGSKYVQSYLGNIFEDVKQHVKLGSQVLFTGTPCQIAGLKHFLGVNYENLLCVTLICHGVPSPGVFSAYVKTLERKKQATVDQIRFRHKYEQWNFVDSMFIRIHGIWGFTKRDAFLLGFLDNLYLRLSCSYCKANSFRSGADIILGDYWGGFLKLKKFDDDRGISAVVVCTEKGSNIFERISGNIHYVSASLKNIARFNPNLYASTKMNAKRDLFFAAYKSDNDFDNLSKQFIKPPFGNFVKRVLGCRIAYWLYDKVKGVMNDG